jgi:ABC-type nitrate/sulfonate/bicarbonate transport system substrate-binding protein
MKVILGFMPLLDCASLVVAAERGFAAEEDLELALVRETSWANIRDRVVVGHFDAAHMLGPMTVASTLGIGHVKVPVIAPFALGVGGNAITVSLRLWEQMTNEGSSARSLPGIHAAALRRVVTSREKAGREQPLTFAMVYPFSCHNYELRYWLAAAGIDPDRDVRLVVIPPPFLVDALRAGQIDGFCVGEPWNSVAVHAGVGTIVLPTTAIWPFSPEKVLGCRLEWAQRHPKQLASLQRALYRASQWCERPENHAELATLLAQPRYVGAPADLLRRALQGQLTLTTNSAPAQLENFYIPARHHATFPWVSHALWFYAQMLRWKQIEFSANHLAAVRSTYRPDLYRAALTGINPDIPVEDSKIERFFDGQTFDPAEFACVRPEPGSA